MVEEYFNLNKRQLILIAKITDAIVKNKFAKVGDLLGEIVLNEKEFVKRLKEVLLQNIPFMTGDEEDYDSCSQEIDGWKINGSRCFDVNNSECKDFLRLWEVCQSHKRRIGSC